MENTENAENNQQDNIIPSAPRRGLGKIVITCIKILAVLVILVAVVIGGAGFYVLKAINTNEVKSYFAEQVSRSLGREFLINGPVTLSVFPSLKLSFSDVTLANAKWAGDAPMMKIAKMDASVAIMPLFSKQIQIGGVHLDGVTLNLVKLAGRDNWTFESEKTVGQEEPKVPKQADQVPAVKQQESAAFPLAVEFASLSLSNVNLIYKDNDKVTKLHINNAKTSMRNLEPLAFTADGEINGTSFSVNVMGDKLAGIFSNADNWPVMGKAKLGGTSLTFDGALHQPQKTGGGEFNVHLAGNGADVAALTGSPLPFGAYDLKTKLVMANTKSLSLLGVDFTTGSTKATGEIKLALYGKPNISGTVNIPTLQLADFAGAGAPPLKQSSLWVKPAMAAEVAASSRIVPPVALPTAAMRAVNADIKFNMGEILQSNQKMASVAGALRLNDGVMQLSPLKLTYFGNVFDGDVTLDGRAETATLKANLNSPQLDFGKLFSELKLTDRVTGIGAMNLVFAGSGRDLRQVAANSHGRFTLTSQQGQFDTGMLFDNIGSVLSAVLPGTNIPSKAKLNCAVLDFTGAGGTWHSSASAVDADTVALTILGDVEMGTEALTLKIAPMIKNTKYGSSIPTLKIAGGLTHPAITTDGSSVVQNAIAAGVLGKVKGAELLAGLVSSQSSPSASAPAAGNVCMAAVLKERAPAATRTAPGGSPAQPASQTEKLNDTIKGLQGLFGK